MRVALQERNTNETAIALNLNLDGSGIFTGSCGIGFFDHMLSLFCRHGLFNLDLNMKGDLYIDGHHSIEDLGLVLGQAFNAALGDKKGITRYGNIILPMDEALIMVAVDLGGRPYLGYDLAIPAACVGEFDCELLPEFLSAFTQQGKFNLHLRQLEGKNSHHIIEGAFKGMARALRQAVAFDAGETGVPSTKGCI